MPKTMAKVLTDDIVQMILQNQLLSPMFRTLVSKLTVLKESSDFVFNFYFKARGCEEFVKKVIIKKAKGKRSFAEFVINNKMQFFSSIQQFRHSGKMQEISLIS